MPQIDASRYGPWAVVCGASEGTGAAFARLLAAGGIKPVLVARRREPLEALAEEIRAEGGECVVAAVDLTTDEAPARIAQAVGDREVGLLIANAGADTYGTPFLDSDIADWNRLIALNISTTTRLVHRFAGPMRARGQGGIILVGSGACYGGLPGVAVYAAAKAFSLVLAEALWAELSPHGVDVLALILGRTDTPAHRELMARKGVPFPSDCASPEEVAQLGLARLPHGPILNWGLADDEAGYAGRSAAQRRARVETIGKAMFAAQAPAAEEGAA